MLDSGSLTILNPALVTALTLLTPRSCPAELWVEFARSRLMDNPVENFYQVKSYPSCRILLFRERGFVLRHSVTVSISRISVNYCAFTKEYVICDVRSRFQEILTGKRFDGENFCVLDRCWVAYLLIRLRSQVTYLEG